MFENFEVNRLFEGHAHEQPHFSLNIQGHDYKGMVHDGKIQWYHPHPKQKVKKEYLASIESQVFDLMSEHLES
ncbi:hypothetical protein BIV60_21405 [Bacillus sp. MUM 116]|uniref:DUF5342 family protein n=1 Tax=Bacillus sp. MUM 116 TaxID=1678002 RepID=UPI0008F58703|nr:DUF5342 family protein [Bacillus sp. MUM 116]OIK10404.1 hypothetical protein BIV60_21405 [Bacillus sp. MUM 116]